MKFSKRAEHMQGSATLLWDMKVKEESKKNADIINLTVGQPDFDTPEFFSEAIRKVSGMKGVNRYANTQGEAGLRKAVAEILQNKKGVSYGEGEVIWTSSKEAIYLAISVLAGPGDEIIVLTPSWPTYGEVICYCDAKPVYVGTDQNFHIDTGKIEKAVTERTKMMIINSPNNPTGAVYRRDEIEKIADIAKKNDLTVISDEVYGSIVYDGRENYSIAKEDGMKERTVIIEGFSKSISIPGFRAGYAAGPKKIIEKMRDLKSNISGNSDSLMQYAMLEVLTEKYSEYLEFEKRLKESFEKRRNYFASRLDVGGSILPEGAFYLFMPIPDKQEKSLNFCEEALKKGVGITPGIFFQKEGYVRISYAITEEKLKKAANILKIWYK